MLCVKDVVKNGREDGLKITIGRDVNAHYYMNLIC